MCVVQCIECFCEISISEHFCDLQTEHELARTKGPTNRYVLRFVLSHDVLRNV
jgi:hypothetical protein